MIATLLFIEGVSAGESSGLATATKDHEVFTTKTRAYMDEYFMYHQADDVQAIDTFRRYCVDDAADPSIKELWAEDIVLSGINEGPWGGHYRSKSAGGKVGFALAGLRSECSTATGNWIDKA